MSYSWDNRVDFVVRYMYDIDNNGFLDANDFQCMALRAAVVEGKGECAPAKLAEHQKTMQTLWNELSDIADDDKDGKISSAEFKDAVKKTCVGKKFEEFPRAMRAFVEPNFAQLDINSDGIVGIEEYRYNCITRIATDDISTIDKAFEALLNDNDKKVGGLDIARFKELYAQYMGNAADNHPAVHLFGPLQ